MKSSVRCLLLFALFAGCVLTACVRTPTAPEGPDPSDDLPGDDTTSVGFAEAPPSAFHGAIGPTVRFVDPA